MPEGTVADIYTQIGLRIDIVINSLLDCYLIAIGLLGLLIAYCTYCPLTYCGHEACASDKLKLAEEGRGRQKMESTRECWMQNRFNRNFNKL